MNRPTDLRAAPMIPDHQLIRLIGEGSYGQIWLARNIVGTYRAVKIVYRSKFQDARPYEREFKGIQEFEPISRSHPGLVDILQIGRNDDAGYFYYVMELADDEVAGRDFHPDNYCARTLGRVWESRGRIAAAESLQIGMNLAAALAHMHRHELVHRDVKPSNIIFVQGQPKLADIGLVVPVSDARTFVGTEGYIPPEGPGSIQADIYGLGKVLYEISTGQDRQSFPELPQELATFTDREMVVELNEIVVKACANTPRARYATAEEMRSDLEFLLAGRSVKRLRFVEKQLARTARVAAVATVLAVIAAVLAFSINRVRQREKRLLADSIAISGIALFEDGNLHASLPLFAEALRLEKDDDAASATHRLRIGSALERSPRLLQFWQHDAEVKDVRFSPDGKTLSVAAGKLAHLMDVRSGRSLLGIPTRHTIETVAFNAEGSKIAVANGDYVRVVDARTGAQLVETKIHGHVNSAEFSPDGNTVALACQKSCAHLLDATSGAVRGELRGHAKAINYAAFSPDGALLVTAGQDGVAHIWNVQTRELLRTLPQTQWVFDAGFSPDGRRIVTACSDHFVRVWDPLSGHQAPLRMEHRGQIRRARFSPDGRWIVSAGLDKTVRFWDALDGSSVISTINLHSPALHAVFSPDGSRVATASQRGEIQIWDIAPSAPLNVGTGIVTADGQRYLTYRSNSFQLWDARDDSAVSGPIATGAEIGLVRASANGGTAVVVGKSNANPVVAVHVYAGSTNIQRFEVPEAGHQTVLSPDGKHLLRFGKSGAGLWNTSSGQLEFASKERAEHGAFSPDNRLLGLAFKSKLVTLELPSGKELFSAPDDKLQVYAMNYSTDSTRLLIAVSDTHFAAGLARVLDARLGKTLCVITQHTDGVQSAVFSQRGDFIATGGEDSEFGIWDSTTGRARIDPISLPWPSWSVSLSDDDRWLAVSTVRDLQVFEVRTGRAAIPVLKTPWFSRSGFCASGKRLWFQTSKGLHFVNLPMAEQSPEEIIAFAHHLGVIIPTPLRWDPKVLPMTELRRRCENEYARSDQRVESFHRERAGAAEEDGEWFAAQFHLEKLLQQRAGDVELQARWHSARSNWFGPRPPAK